MIEILTKIISCRIFKPYLDMITHEDHQVFDIDYIDIDAHDTPNLLNRQLQEKINQYSNYDLILLFYGICGNATKGLFNPNGKLGIIKTHDCLGVLCGSNHRYNELLASTPDLRWRCLATTTLDRSQKYFEYYEMFGEENAKYLIDVLYVQNQTLHYLSMDTQDDDLAIAKLKEHEVVIIKGNLSRMRAILSGNEGDVLILERYQKPQFLYDEDFIMTSGDK